LPEFYLRRASIREVERKALEKIGKIRKIEKRWIWILGNGKLESSFEFLELNLQKRVSAGSVSNRYVFIRTLAYLVKLAHLAQIG
jgi:hypothetical protein